MLSDSMVKSLYFDFHKYASRKDGHIVHALLWNGTKKMFNSTDLNRLDYACLMAKGASHMAGDNTPTKDGEYCLSFDNSSIDDDCDEFDWMKFSVEQFAEANQAYIVIGTGAFDEKDPLVFPRKRFEKEFKPVLTKHNHVDFQRAMNLAYDGIPVSEPSLNGVIFAPKHLFFTNSVGKKYEIEQHLVLFNPDTYSCKIINQLDLPDSSHWYVSK